jgi:hypothetical protein
LGCERPPTRCALATDALADVSPMTYCAFYASKRGVKRWLVEVDYTTTDCDLQRMLCKAHGVLVSWSRADSKGLVIFPSTPQAPALKSLREELKVVSIVDEYGNGYAQECSWNQHGDEPL